jgi:hypothetical protein
MSDPMSGNLDPFNLDLRNAGPAISGIWSDEEGQVYGLCPACGHTARLLVETPRLEDCVFECAACGTRATSQYIGWRVDQG